MLGNKLISFSKNLSTEFINHIKSTNNLCIYKLGAHYIPQNVIFPKTDTITLINCNKEGIQNILTPTIFPNLNKINYLSANPGNYLIFDRFKNDIKWVFLNKKYDLYNYMVEAGRATKDSNIIREYIANKKIIDGKNEFDISFHFDLNIPGFGITDGEWWRSQFYEYLVKQQNINNHKYCMYPGEFGSLQDEEELKLQREYVKSSIDTLNFDCIDDN